MLHRRRPAPLVRRRRRLPRVAVRLAAADAGRRRGRAAGRSPCSRTGPTLVEGRRHVRAVRPGRADRGDAAARRRSTRRCGTPVFPPDDAGARAGAARLERTGTGARSTRPGARLRPSCCTWRPWCSSPTVAARLRLGAPAAVGRSTVLGRGGVRGAPPVRRVADHRALRRDARRVARADRDVAGRDREDHRVHARAARRMVMELHRARRFYERPEAAGRVPRAPDPEATLPAAAAPGARLPRALRDGRRPPDAAAHARPGRSTSRSTTSPAPATSQWLSARIVAGGDTRPCRLDPHALPGRRRRARHGGRDRRTGATAGCASATTSASRCSTWTPTARR